MNNSNGNLHHTRAAGDKQVSTILAGILPIRHPISQRTKHRRLGKTGAHSESQQQVGVSGPTHTDILEGMETSSGRSVIMRWHPNTTTREMVQKTPPTTMMVSRL
jgi:hypothetical protein